MLYIKSIFMYIAINRYEIMALSNHLANESISIIHKQFLLHPLTYYDYIFLIIYNVLR